MLQSSPRAASQEPLPQQAPQSPEHDPQSSPEATSHVALPQAPVEQPPQFVRHSLAQIQSQYCVQQYESMAQTLSWQVQLLQPGVGRGEHHAA